MFPFGEFFHSASLSASWAAFTASAAGRSSRLFSSLSLALPVYTVAGAALMGTFVTSVAGVAFYQVHCPLLPEHVGGSGLVPGAFVRAGGNGGHVSGRALPEIYLAQGYQVDAGRHHRLDQPKVCGRIFGVLASPQEVRNMRQTGENTCGADLKCPECHRPLKPFRIKREGGKELICGGCGREFSCDDLTAPDGDEGAES